MSFKVTDMRKRHRTFMECETTILTKNLMILNKIDTIKEMGETLYTIFNNKITQDVFSSTLIGKSKVFLIHN